MASMLRRAPVRRSREKELLCDRIDGAMPRQRPTYSSTVRRSTPNFTQPSTLVNAGLTEMTFTPRLAAQRVTSLMNVL